MNYSKQRESMLTYLRSTTSHPTANEIYTEMRKSNPTISLGTVYRNLSLLTDTGQILRIDTDDCCTHYDGRTEPHYHFVCGKCGRVYDLTIQLPNLDKLVEAELGCTVSGHSLIFNGVCKDCRAESGL